jgi:hypothetical protein
MLSTYRMRQFDRNSNLQDRRQAGRSLSSRAQVQLMPQPKKDTWLTGRVVQADRAMHHLERLQQRRVLQCACVQLMPTAIPLPMDQENPRLMP